MKTFKQKNSFHVILALVLSIMVTITIFQNCAPQGFSVDTASMGPGPLMDGGDTQDPIVPKPSYPRFNLMSANQVYQSYLNLTGVLESDNIRAEFQRRKSSFSDQGSLLSINSPYAFAQLSIAGEVCSELVTREAGQNSAQRRFFSGVDFTRPIANLDNVSYRSVLQNLSQNFLKSSPSEEFLNSMLEFKVTFTQGSTDSSTQLRLLLTATCAILLGNIENAQL